MSMPPKAEAARARALLSAAAREGRGRLARPILLGIASIACGIAQVWLIARVLAALLGHGFSRSRAGGMPAGRSSPGPPR
jgi:ATP-binding cassette subfamily C protein CydD